MAPGPSAPPVTVPAVVSTDGPDAISRIDDAARRLKAAAAAASSPASDPPGLEGLEQARIEVRRARAEIDRIAERLEEILDPAGARRRC